MVKTKVSVRLLLFFLTEWWKMDNIATTHWIINTEVFQWEIQNGEFHFSIFIDKFPNGLF